MSQINTKKFVYHTLPVTPFKHFILEKCLIVYCNVALKFESCNFCLSICLFVRPIIIRNLWTDLPHILVGELRMPTGMFFAYGFEILN